MLFILSYRRNFTRHFHGDTRPVKQTDSDVAVHTAENEEAAATWIAGRLAEDDDPRYLHLVFDRWDHVVAVGLGGYVPEGERGVSSVIVRGRAPRDETYEADAREEARLEDLELRLRALVAEKCEAHRRAKQAAEERAQADAVVRERAAKEAQERAELARLRAKFGGS
jgi:hypothetical protein